MSDSADFANIPFAALAKKLSAAGEPDKNALEVSGGLASPREKKQSPKFSHRTAPAYTEQGEGADDSQLFLQAVQQVRPIFVQGKSAPHGAGWRLEEAVELPKMSKSAKKQKTLSTQSPPLPQSPYVSTGAPRQKLTAGANAVHVMTDIALGDDAASADERAFFRAMHEVQPLSGKGRDVVPEVKPAVSLELAANALQDFLDGKLEFALALIGEYLEGYVVGLDEVTMNKLRAGQYSPEAHLDLHGLNAMQAYQALVGFFRSAWYKGMRTVLVVPGRGRNSHDGFGILRDKLQSWLTQEPFKRVVLAFCTARPVDGGPGSVYVLLRKYRKKGKIYWERTPVDPDLF